MRLRKQGLIDCCSQILVAELIDLRLLAEDLAAAVQVRRVLLVFPDCNGIQIMLVIVKNLHDVRNVGWLQLSLQVALHRQTLCVGVSQLIPRVCIEELAKMPVNNQVAMSIKAKTRHGWHGSGGVGKA